METFDGKHILLDGPDGNKIDCMFFPCTNKEEVIVDLSVSLDGKKVSDKHRSVDTRVGTLSNDVYSSGLTSPRLVSHFTASSGDETINMTEPQYMSKPTVIMCNPNALYYQQMVTSPNAYWLNFFLKRDINVLCWNYRGYGDSTRGFMETVSPYKCKRDAEYVLALLVN